MGYRASAITEQTGLNIPQWFKDKWDNELSIPVYEGSMFAKKYIGKPKTPIAYLYERKGHYDILEDLQKVVEQDKEWSGDNLQMVMMHEDGKVNRINIYANKLVIEAPTNWKEVHTLHGNFT